MPDTPLDGQLLNQLPTPYRSDSATADFLKAFEAILLTGAGPGGGSAIAVPGIEQRIAQLATYFVAQDLESTRTQAAEEAPEEFLPWLASWLAFSIRADLPKSARRDFIHNLTTLYRWRGTRENLKRVLGYFTGLPSTESTVTVSDAEPHYFEVRLDLHRLIAEQPLSEVPRLMEIAHALIRREKPAHTRYVLLPQFPSFRIGGLDANGNRTPFVAQVHGYVERTGPSGSAETIEVGNTLLGVNTWTSKNA